MRVRSIPELDRAWFLLKAKAKRIDAERRLAVKIAEERRLRKGGRP